jgi:glycosyltransferase involved in cell wall biosynthesis
MRVVFLTHNYPRHAGDVAGSFLHPLAAALVRLGHEVTVVAPSDRGDATEARRDGVMVRRVRYASAEREQYAYTGTMQRALRSPAGWWAMAGLWRALRQGARDASAGGAVVHAHWWIPAGLAAPPELPLVLTLHGTDAALLERSALARTLARPALRRARVVTAVSGPMARTAAAASGRPVAAIPVQPMPVDSAGWGWSMGGGGAVVVARLTSQKRVDLALRALGELRRRGREVSGTIIGEGPERPALEALARDLGIAGSVTFTGALPFDRVLSSLLTADFALQLSRREGFGLAAAEALMVGVPVVACRDGGGLTDVVPPSGAGRITAPDPSAIASGITDLVADPEAPGETRRTGEAWRARLAPDTVAQRFAGWYAEAASA